MRALWLAVIFGIPMILIAHWGLNIASQNERSTVSRIVALLHLIFFLMLAAVFAIQVLPIADAAPIAVLGIGTLGALLAALAVHLHLKIAGWMDRWPPGLGLAVAYVWLIPALWTLLSGHNLFNAIGFTRRGLWITPAYNPAFHWALWVGTALCAAFAVSLWHLQRVERDASRAQAISALGWGIVWLTACLLGLGALLPSVTPAWMPPYPYLIGMIAWLVAVRITIVRHDWLPSSLLRYRSLFALSPTPIVMVDRIGTVIEQNPAAEALLGPIEHWAEACGALSTKEWGRYRNAWARRSPIEGWELLVETNGNGPRAMEVHGQYVSLGERWYGILTLHDHTVDKDRQNALTQLAQQDALTGVLSRNAFASQVETAMKAPAPMAQKFAILFVDLDRFKQLNDRYGHLAGDQALLSVVDRLRGALEPGDVLGRFGGDEFFILAANTRDEATLGALVQRIHHAMKAPILVDGGIPVVLTASIGWSWYPEDGTDVTRLFAKADARMYQVKRQITLPAESPVQ